MPQLEGRYDYRTAEPRLQAEWAAKGTYEFDPDHTGPAYTVDTPPPTVSGQIHVGHVFSYTHADIMIRYHRMKGETILYPFGFDDNGLPTERFTENARGIRAREVGRRAFIEACLELSEEVEAKFERFWKRLGLSVDWRLRYSTIDPRSRRISQGAFLDLLDQGHVYRQVAPTLWCPECRTAVAQADVDDKQGVAAAFSTIPFELTDGSGDIRIATTRPELLSACVAVFVHPDDPRYASLVGKHARTPIFGAEVPILADEHAEREKGTGAVMCCTFGDVTDVGWWRSHGLPLRIRITPEGRMTEETGEYSGLRIKQARAKILEDLRAAGKVLDERPIEHTVGVHERCGTDIEYLVAGQWFVKLLDNKERFVEAGRQIRWHPEHMRARYESWIEGLNWDWNISRQRYYGVPFPIWYCKGCGEVIPAGRDQLPVDPQEDQPPVDACSECGGKDFEPDTDIMDTWATSSLTPRIVGTTLEALGVSAEEFDRRYRPMSLRPNAHDIIRTWDFYTIVRSLYGRDEIPWTDVLVSGHALDPAGKKISKSKLKTAEDPTGMLERFSADAVRYWTASVRTGGDTLLSEEVFKNGSRLVTKLWNASKLSLAHLGGYTPPSEPPALNPTDAWLLARLAETIDRATASFEEYEFGAAKAEVERFFWGDFCDNYLELVKARLYGDADGAPADEAAREGARYALYHVLLGVLKLLAPFMPHITEEIYQAGFVGTEEGFASIHCSRWPEAAAAWRDPAALERGQAILDFVEAVRRWKADRQISVGAPVATVRVAAPEAARQTLAAALVDLRGVSRASQIDLADAPDGAMEVEVEA